MIINIFIIITLSGALSFGPGLVVAQENRMNIPTDYPLSKDFNYPCVVGVPNGYNWLIGHEVYFLREDNKVIGPFGVVDVEADHHAGQMKERKLLADVFCYDDSHDNLVHQKGMLAIRINLKWKNGS